MTNQHRFTKPSDALTRLDIKLDNFALVTANLMPFMSDYRALSDRQPKGTAVLVLPSPTSALRFVYITIAKALRSQGKSVRIYCVGKAYQGQHPPSQFCSSRLCTGHLREKGLGGLMKVA